MLGATIETHTDTGMFDRVQLGRRLRAARVLAGYRRMDAVQRELEARFGHVYSLRGLYAMERGAQEPHMQLLFRLMMIYDPPNGLEFWGDAIRDEEAWEWFTGMVRKSFSRS